MNNSQPGTLTASMCSDLVAAATLAPSPDNNQPWRFTVEGGQLVVHLDREQALPSDVNGMFDLMGVGAALENLSLAAGRQGYSAEIEMIRGIRENDLRVVVPVARIMLRPAGQPDSLSEFLAERRTNRLPFSKRPVADKSRRALAEAVAAVEGVQLDFLTDRAQIRAMARIAAATDLIRFQYEPFHNEIFRQLRFTREEAERTCDGLDVRTLALPPGTTAVLRLLRPWSRMRRLHRLGLGRMLTVPTMRSVRSSGALGILSVDKATLPRFLAGGRAMQRAWLATTAEGLELHPLGSPAIFFGHLAQLDGRKLSSHHKRRLAILINRFTDLVPQVGKRTLLMVFRIGHAPAPSCRSLRRPVDAVFSPPGPSQKVESPVVLPSLSLPPLPLETPMEPMD